MKLKFTWFVIACLTLFFAQLSAKECTRCKIIEGERAQRQAREGVHPLRYYDEMLALEDTKIYNGTQQSAIPNRKIDNNSSTIENPAIPNSNYNTSSSAITLPPDRAPFLHSTILDVLKTKQFMETLNGPFTLFIPTNNALRTLPPNMLTDLTKSTNEEMLASIVSNHLVPQKILRQDFNKPFKTLAGKNLQITQHDNYLSVGNARILLAEPAGKNGVIYVIDRVLIPSSSEANSNNF